jgi:hypothetical protein
MTKTRKLSTMFISAMVLGTIVFTGSAFSPNAPAAQAAGLPYCTYSTYYTRSNIFVAGKYQTVGFHLPSASGFNRNCKNDTGNQNTLSAVIVIQNAANAFYGKGLSKDGKYGPNTAKAVKDIQIIGGLPKSQQDSVYGPVTCSRTWFPLQVPRGSFLQNTSGCSFYVPGIA